MKMREETKATLSAIGKALNINAIPPAVNDFDPSQLHAYARFLLAGKPVEQAIDLTLCMEPLLDALYRMSGCLGRATNRLECMSKALDAIMPMSATDIDTGGH